MEVAAPMGQQRGCVSVAHHAGEREPTGSVVDQIAQILSPADAPASSAGWLEVPG